MEFAILIHFPVFSAYQFSAQNATFQLSQIFFSIILDMQILSELSPR